GKEEGVLAGAALAIAKPDPPQPLGTRTVEAAVEDQRLAVRVLELTQEAAGLQLKDVDTAVAEVADQQVAAELAEAVRGDRHAPGRIERGQGAARCRPRGEALEEVAAGVELIDEAVAGTFDVVVLFGVLLGVSNE